MVDKKWVAFFSQTGSEILNISKRLGKFPDTIICNGFLDKTNKELLENKSVIYTRTKPTVSDYKQFIGSDKDTLVTLHGWLRIVPREVCEHYNNIWNLHPGLITKYPELKGKDPQERVFNKSHLYPDIGVVIHEVVPEVDEGPIKIEKSIKNIFANKDDLYYNLHSIATEAWSEFLNETV